MNLPVAALDAGVSSFLSAVQLLNSETSYEMLNAEFYLFFGGVAIAFAMGAFSMVVRGTKGAAREIDL